jgi:CO/xanthine dehydrogenase FAD-binding subunit
LGSYHRPATLKEALEVLANTSATIAAGCTDLFPATDRPALSGPVLDITGIRALKGIVVTPTHIRIGATATWADLIRADLPPGFDMLKQAASEVGSVQIQTAATVAGNICNASPAADGVPCLLALEAEVEMTSSRGQRSLPLDQFLTGVRQTALAPDEMVTAILIPQGAAAGCSCFLKLGARKYLVISIAMVAARLEVEEGMITRAALAVGACSAVATRLPRLEAALTGQPLATGAGLVSEPLIARELSPIDDIRADAPYRLHAAIELLRRTLNELAVETKGQAA